MHGRMGYLRDAFGERRRGGRRDVCCADEHLHSDGAAVDLDAVKDSCGLDGLLMLVEDNSSAAEAATGRAILEEDLLRPDVDNLSKVFLLGVLVVVTGVCFAKAEEYKSTQRRSDSRDIHGSAVVSATRKACLMDRRRMCCAAVAIHRNMCLLR